MQSLLLELMQIPFVYITSNCVCSKAGGCPAHVLPVWVCDGSRAQLHRMNQTVGPLPHLKVMLYTDTLHTHMHTQTKEWEQTIHINGATNAFLNLFMSRGKVSGGDIQTQCLLTYAWFL